MAQCLPDFVRSEAWSVRRRPEMRNILGGSQAQRMAVYATHIPATIPIFLIECNSWGRPAGSSKLNSFPREKSSGFREYYLRRTGNPREERVVYRARLCICHQSGTKNGRRLNEGRKEGWRKIRKPGEDADFLVEAAVADAGALSATGAAAGRRQPVCALTPVRCCP